MSTLAEARDAAESLMDLPGIVGLGLDDQAGKLLVLVSGPLSPEVLHQVPGEVKGWPVEIQLSMDIESKKEDRDE
jgi:hypothetical protein